MLNDFMLTFAANRAVTYQILDKLSDEELNRKWNRPGLDTFTKHFQEMAVVTNAYADAMVTGNMDFSNVPDVFGFSDKVSKEELVAMLKESDKKLETIVHDKTYKESVFWFDMDLPVTQHFVNIISHEIFHQGMMTMFMYQSGIKMPQELMDNWSLPEA